MTAADKAKLETELAGELRSWKVITRLVWADAICVMLVGLGVVYQLLQAHGFPKEIAWLVAPTVDIGLVVGLFGSQDLARHGIKSGWIGALRWVCAALTWALNTAPSWLAPGGPKVPGILLHSVAPVLLFFVTEAAAYFMAKKGRIIASLRQRIDAAEADDRADRAQRAELQERVRRTEAERITAASEADRLRADRDRLAALQEQQQADHERAVEALRSELETVRHALSTSAEAALESANRQHAQMLSDLAEKHATELARVRAESGTVSLDRYRETHAGKRDRQRSGSASRRVVLSDEEAAQKCLDAHPEPDYVWSYRTVAEAAQVGQKRAPDIIAAIEKHHANRAAGRPAGSARETSGGESADDPKERHDELVHAG